MSSKALDDLIESTLQDLEQARVLPARQSLLGDCEKGTNEPDRPRDGAQPVDGPAQADTVTKSGSSQGQERNVNICADVRCDESNSHSDQKDLESAATAQGAPAAVLKNDNGKGGALDAKGTSEPSKGSTADKNGQASTSPEDALSFCLKSLERELKQLQLDHPQHQPPGPNAEGAKGDHLNSSEDAACDEGLMKTLQTLAQLLQCIEQESGALPGSTAAPEDGSSAATQRAPGDASPLGEFLKTDPTIRALENCTPHVQALAEPIEEMLRIYEPWLADQQERQKRNRRADESNSHHQQPDEPALPPEELERCGKQVALFKRIAALCAVQQEQTQERRGGQDEADAATASWQKLMELQQLLEEAHALGDLPDEVQQKLRVAETSKPSASGCADAATTPAQSASEFEGSGSCMNEGDDLKDFISFVGALQEAAAAEGINLLDPSLLQQVLQGDSASNPHVTKLLDHVERQQEEQERQNQQSRRNTATPKDTELQQDQITAKQSMDIAEAEQRCRQQ